MNIFLVSLGVAMVTAGIILFIASWLSDDDNEKEDVFP